MPLGHQRAEFLNLSMKVWVVSSFSYMVCSRVSTATSMLWSMNHARKWLFRFLKVLMVPGWSLMIQLTARFLRPTMKCLIQECIIGGKVPHLWYEVIDMLAGGTLAIELVQGWWLEFVRVTDRVPLHGVGSSSPASYNFSRFTTTSMCCLSPLMRLERLPHCLKARCA